MKCYWRHAPTLTFLAFFFAGLLALEIHWANWWWALYDAVLMILNLFFAKREVRRTHELQAEKAAILKAIQDRRKAVFWHSYEKEKEEE